MVRRNAAAIGLMLLLSVTAAADKPNNRPPDNRPPDKGQPTNVEQTQSQQAEAQAAAQATAEAQAASQSASESAAHATGGNAEAHGGSATASATGGDGGQGGAASATNEGISVSNEGDSYSSESTNTNVVLVPNNNTSDCNRVYGISFGNGDGAGALGVPFRDKACDYEQAADDAAASGEHKIAWWWRCHKPALYKTFKQKGDSNDMAQIKCWNSMVQMLQTDEVEEEAANFNEPQLNLVAADEFDANTLVAELSESDLAELKAELAKQDRQQGRVQARQMQQQVVIERQETEIERLKREAAELKAEQEERKAKERATQEYFKQRLKAKEAAQ